MLNLLPVFSFLLSQYEDMDLGALAGMSAGMYIVDIVICVVEIIGMWKMFEKAGVPGWTALIPFYNIYTAFKISWGNGWLFLLCFVCGIGYFMLPFKLAPAYGKGIGFAFGLLFLGPIFYMILGFDDSQYLGPQ